MRSVYVPPVLLRFVFKLYVPIRSVQPFRWNVNLLYVPIHSVYVPHTFLLHVCKTCLNVIRSYTFRATLLSIFQNSNFPYVLCPTMSGLCPQMAIPIKFLYVPYTFLYVPSRSWLFWLVVILCSCSRLGCQPMSQLIHKAVQGCRVRDPLDRLQLLVGETHVLNVYVPIRSVQHSRQSVRLLYVPIRSVQPSRQSVKLLYVPMRSV